MDKLEWCYNRCQGISMILRCRREVSLSYLLSILSMLGASSFRELGALWPYLGCSRLSSSFRSLDGKAKP
jgi:hypothetical protein